MRSILKISSFLHQKSRSRAEHPEILKQTHIQTYIRTYIHTYIHTYGNTYAMGLPALESLATWGRKAFIQVTCLVATKPAPEPPNLPSHRRDLTTWGRRAFIQVTCLVATKPAPEPPNLPSHRRDLTTWGRKAFRSLVWCPQSPLQTPRICRLVRRSDLATWSLILVPPKTRPRPPEFAVW